MPGGGLQLFRGGGENKEGAASSTFSCPGRAWPPQGGVTFGKEGLGRWKGRVSWWGAWVDASMKVVRSRWRG